MTRDASEYGTRLLPTLIDEIAMNTPDRTYAATPKDEADMSKGFENISYANFARAIDGVSWWLDNTLGETYGRFPTFAYFGPRDLGYAIVVVAAAKTGRKVLLPSQLASPDAHMFLLSSLSCTAVIYSAGFTALAQSLQAEYQEAQYICTPSLATWLASPDVVGSYPRYGYTKA